MHFYDIDSPWNRQKVIRTCGDFNIVTWNVLRARTVYILSTSQLPKVTQTCGDFNIFPSKCNSRKQRRAPLQRACFSTLRSHITVKKKPVFRDFSTFSRTCIFSLLTLSISYLLHISSSHFWLSPWLSFFLALFFHLAILSEVSLLRFLRSNRNDQISRRNAASSSCSSKALQHRLSLAPTTWESKGSTHGQNSWTCLEEWWVQLSSAKKNQATSVELHGANAYRLQLSYLRCCF